MRGIKAASLAAGTLLRFTTSAPIITQEENMSEVVPIGSLPPVGEVPDRMLAEVVRTDRMGDPRAAFQARKWMFLGRGLARCSSP